MNNNQQNFFRDVRTLLFSKMIPTDIQPNNTSTSTHLSSAQVHDAMYAQISQPDQYLAEDGLSPITSQLYKKTFLTFGGFDAISAYCPNSKFWKNDWLHYIYKDKQQLIRKLPDNLVHNQMHLVSQYYDTSSFWIVKDEDYPYFLTAMVYGVVSQKEDKEALYNESDTNGSSSMNLECSIYERVVRKRLQTYLAEHPMDVKYAVYNGITVSDVVVLVRAKDLQDMINLISYLEYSGTARKSLATVGFPVNEQGRVLPCVFDSLISDYYKAINVSIHGSVLNASAFLEVRDYLTSCRTGATTDRICYNVQQLLQSDFSNSQMQQKILSLMDAAGVEDQVIDDVRLRMEKGDNEDDTRKHLLQMTDTICANLSRAIPEDRWSLSLGKNDFTVSARISYAQLAHLLEVYREKHQEIRHACWEMLTELSTNHPDKDLGWFRGVKEPSNILSQVYQDIRNLYHPSPVESRPQLDLSQFSWSDSMLELLGTHYYIDRHPVLHGPSYLIYKSLKIAHAYFAGNVKDFESIDKRVQLLHRSKRNIIHFIRNWDQLTEQISRNDDAMLNNRCNTHTIHFSLPESALDFYHAFLRRIVDYLMEYDQKLKPDDFEYDFLLSPKPTRRFRFSPMFKTEHRDHAPETGTVWPHKQAYILELPLESIFQPMDIFIPVVHECFHCFGDVLRQRKERKQYMALFIAANLVTAIGCGYSDHQKLFISLAREIYKSPGEETPYLSTTWHQLRNNTLQVLGYDGLDTLFQDTDGDYYCLYSENVMHMWNTAKDSFLNQRNTSLNRADSVMLVDSILHACRFYFKECYADAMTIALLDLRPEEYLARFKDEIRQFYIERLNARNQLHTHDIIDGAVITLAQRVAIVLAACTQSQHVQKFHYDTCIQAICQFADAPQVSASDCELKEFAEIVDCCYTPLIDDTQTIPIGNSYHPPAALMQVVEYLVSSISLLHTNPPDLKLNLKFGTEVKRHYTLDTLSSDFDHIIRRGNMFGKRFYQLIYEHHDEVREKVESSKVTEPITDS